MSCLSTLKMSYFVLSISSSPLTPQLYTTGDILPEPRYTTNEEWINARLDSITWVEMSDFNGEILAINAVR